MTTPLSYTAVVEHDKDSGMYVGIVPALPGTHSQAPTVDALRDNLSQVIKLVADVLIRNGETMNEDVSVVLEKIEVSL